MSSYNPLPSMNGWNTQITFPLNRGICGFGNLVVISHCKSSEKNEIHLNSIGDLNNRDSSISLWYDVYQTL